VKPNILLPAHVQREQQAREIKEQIAKQQIRHARFLRNLKVELLAVLPESGEVSPEAIYEMCRILLNKPKPVLGSDLLTCSEMGQLMSEVLLGPNVGYEIKTNPSPSSN